VADPVYTSRTVSDDQLSYLQDRTDIVDHLPTKYNSPSNDGNRSTWTDV